MDRIPLPSHIHYELLLQLLERQTAHAVGNQPQLREQLNELIITLRKARSQQRHLEETCQRAHIDIDFHWSLNNDASEPSPSERSLPS
ncbi:MAG TPA: DUF5340 domain-containing protein [Candidatus Obscuribacterales bacterium]